MTRIFGRRPLSRLNVTLRSPRRRRLLESRPTRRNVVAEMALFSTSYGCRGSRKAPRPSLQFSACSGLPRKSRVRWFCKSTKRKYLGRMYQTTFYTGIDIKDEHEIIDDLDATL